MNLINSRFRILPILSAIFLMMFFVNPTAASVSTITKPTAVPVLHTSSVNPGVSLLDSSFDPSLVGGSPFCSSGSLGTILCYPPNFLKTAYNFPSTTGRHGLDGRGQTIVIVDAFGSPTIQSDLDTYDAAFGVPSTTVTILCGPTWTGAATDICPVKTIADLTTAPNALLCGATGWAEETTLDVTMAHSLAPGAHIVLLVANDCYDSSLYGAEQAIVTQWQYRGSIMTQSFGEPDDLVTCTALDPTNTYCISWDPTLLNQPNYVFQTAKMNHWTVIASTGDEGANEDVAFLGTLGLMPSFPGTSPLVLAAGGTQGSPYGGAYGGPPGPGGTFTCAAGATCNTGLVMINGGANGCGTAVRPGEPTSCYPTGYGGESTWNEVTTFGSIGYTSGGGISTLYSVPSYQLFTPHKFTTLLGSTVKATGRLTPDVSFNSAVYGGVQAYLGFLGRWAVFGGTSAASPAWAGIMALANQANGRPLGFVNPTIYAIGVLGTIFSHFSPFHDITQGNNAACSGLCGEDGYLAGRGYDLTTGWGTPNVSLLINLLAGN
ncbi:MAG: S53 family peptidase [Nitrososphaerales archaeon]